MNFLDHSLTNRSQWATYRQLELIPESIANPAHQANSLTSCLNAVWRPLLALLMEELVAEQRVEYLDRCWALNEFGEVEQASTNSLQRFWTLIN